MAQDLFIIVLILPITETTMKILPKKKTPNPVKMAEGQVVVM